MDPFEEAGETDVSDDEHSNDEEPRIKDVLGNPHYIKEKILLVNDACCQWVYLCIRLEGYNV